MAKTRPSKRSAKSKSTKKKSLLHSTGAFSSNPLSTSSTTTTTTTTTSSATESVPYLLAAATKLLHDQSSPNEALTLATRVLTRDPNHLPTLELLAEIQLELGDVESAYTLYERAATLDANGSITGPEKFLWLAQLTPDGGESTIGWFERAVTILRTSNSVGVAEEERGKKLVSALCAMAEVYMSDLCMSPDAEARCESYVSEALLTSPDSCEALQTLASVRISQERVSDAAAALERAWAAITKEGGEVPSYAVRIGLARLLIEVAQYPTALEVLEQLQEEDDTLPDLWYLGGWTLVLMGEAEGGMEKQDAWEAAREWLGRCRKMCAALEWEDEGIREHTEELLGKIGGELEEKMEEEGEDGGEEEGGEEEWESDSGDEEMKG